MPRTTILLPLILSISLAGCAGSKDTVLPDNGRTIADIYSEHFSDIGFNGTLATRDAINHRPVHGNDHDLDGFVRDAYNELDRHFPRLPNPTLVLFVYPHLTGADRVPIPGYATTFTLYRQVEYALPDEVHAEAPRTRSGR